MLAWDHKADSLSQSSLVANMLEAGVDRMRLLTCAAQIQGFLLIFRWITWWVHLYVDYWLRRHDMLRGDLCGSQCLTMIGVSRARKFRSFWRPILRCDCDKRRRWTRWIAVKLWTCSAGERGKRLLMIWLIQQGLLCHAAALSLRRAVSLCQLYSPQSYLIAMDNIQKSAVKWFVLDTIYLTSRALNW